MASAWAQATDLERIRQLGRQFEFGARMAVSMQVRHLATMDPGVGLQVLAPAQARMTRVGSPAANATFAAALVDTGLDPSVYAVALRRIARTDELDGIIALFASPASGFMTGQAVVVDGGASL